MVNDHLSDFVTRIRNGYQAGLKVVEMPASKLILGFAEVLKQENYVDKVTSENNILSVTLKYSKGRPAVTGINRISKPGARIYVSVDNIPQVWGGLGINILSTPKGVVSDKSAKKLSTGGELLARVW